MVDRHDRAGVLARRRTSAGSNTGTDLLTAIIGLVGRNKRRYGGYIVHLGIVLIFLGFAGNGFKRDAQVPLKPGQETTLGSYTLRNDGIKVADDGQKQMVTAYMAVFAEREADRHAVSGALGITASTRTSRRPRSRSAGRSPKISTLVLAVDAQSSRRSRRTCRFIVNPLVNWIWFGFGDHGARHRHRAAAGACRTRSRSRSCRPKRGGRDHHRRCCSLSPARAATARAQARDAGSRRRHADVVLRAHAVREADAARDRLHVRRCGHISIAECRKDPCAASHEMRGELAALIDQGMNHDEIIQAFIAKYGSEEMLGAPIDKGFNRLAWLLPYLLGASGAVAVGFAAVKWTRRADARGRCRRRRSTPRSKSGSTMSSETSTERSPAARAHRRPGPATLAVLRARGARLRDRRDLHRARPGRHGGHLARRADGDGGARRHGRAARRCVRSFGRGRSRR